MNIYTVHFNRPDLIKYQLLSIKKLGYNSNVIGFHLCNSSNWTGRNQSQYKNKFLERIFKNNE